MKNTSHINELLNTFHQKGKECDYGCMEDNLDKYWKIAVDLAGIHKNAYAVKDWIWCDVMKDKKEVSVIKANQVFRTNNSLFNIGDWVRTSPIIDISHNCICETTYSFYVLVGEGTRKESDQTIFSFVG